MKLSEVVVDESVEVLTTVLISVLKVVVDSEKRGRKLNDFDNNQKIGFLCLNQYHFVKGYTLLSNNNVNFCAVLQQVINLIRLKLIGLHKEDEQILK